MKKIKVVIVDSGVNYHHSVLKQDDIKIINVDNPEELIDEYGHGTAIYGILRKYSFIDIVNIKLSNIEENTAAIDLIQALEYIYTNIDADIINLSLGINCSDDLKDLYRICQKLDNKGVILISAFDNTGAFAYPAAFDNVIGVISGQNCYKITDFEYIEDTVVNIAAKGAAQRLMWVKPEYIFLGGNSFACAHVTVQAAKFLLNKKMPREEILVKFRNLAKNRYSLKEERKKNIAFKINNAVLFPFNKEMHSVVRYAHLLPFNIKGIYDTKYSLNIGIKTTQIIKDTQIPELQVQKIEDINWDKFDTLILGHIDAFSNLIQTGNEIVDLLKMAQVKGKFVYCFDDFAENLLKSEKCNFFCPKVMQEDVPPNRFGMLYRISKPVLGVFGTSARQGKYTLQLKLRELFLKKGYDIGQIGTEPTAPLFGMDYVYPIGHNATTYIKEFDAIRYLNNAINEMCLKGKELIIVGSQSGTIPYDMGNAGQLTISQYYFLMGTQPDAVILCINPFDNTDYIKRTINFIESSVECKVLAMVVFPFKLKSSWSGIYGGIEELSEEDYNNFKTCLNSFFDIPVLKLGNEIEMETLCQLIIDSF